MRRHGTLQEGWRFWLPVAILFALLGCKHPKAYSDSGSAYVLCSSPSATITPGTTGTLYVNCGIYTTETSNNYHLFYSSNNFVAPSYLLLHYGLHFLVATLQPSVISPDNTVTNIAGTSSGFTGSLLNTNSVKNLQFQYSIPASSQTVAGLYTTYLTTGYYQYRICTSESCQQHVSSGTAPFYLSANIQSNPITVSCDSPSVNAPPGGGAFSLSVTCTISGGSASNVSPSTQNLFSPGTITLSQGGKSISAILQPTVTSPDSSVTGISGTASGGFTGNINALPAKVMAQYQGVTSATTPAGAYTSAPVIFTWSTI